MDSFEMENWDENWSSSSDSEETGSSYSEDSNCSLRMESVNVLGEKFLLPQSLCDNPQVFKEFFSLDLWNNFSDHQKQHLENFLPTFPENDAEEKAKTLKMLFNRENVRFGNPLSDFFKQLRAGYFRPDLRRAKDRLKRIRYQEYKKWLRWYYFKTMKSVLGSRQRLVSAVVNGEKPKVSPPVKQKTGVVLSPAVKSRYFQELALIKEEIGETTESSEDENYPEGPVNAGMKKGKRSVSLAELNVSEGLQPVLGTLSTLPFPWDQGKVPHYNPYTVTEQSYSQILAQHSKRRSTKQEHPDLDTEGISLHDVIQRCSKFIKKSSSKPSVIIKKNKVKVKKENTGTSMSSPMVEEEEPSDTEEATNMLLKMEPDFEEEVETIKVEMDTIDDLPSLPLIVRQNSAVNTTPSPPKMSKQPLKRQQKAESVESMKKVVGTQVSVEEASPIEKKPKVTILKAEPELSPPKARLPLTPATLSDLDGIDMMDLPVDFDESPTLSLEEMSSHPELMQDTHACFFSLIRDILLSTPDHRMEPRDLELRVKAWANNPIAPLNPWYSPQLETRLQSAVHFLAGDSSEPVPEDYVPYMEWKVAAKAYQWIGAGRDSDHRLVALCAIWGERSTTVSCTETPTTTTASLGVLAPTGPPPPRGPAVQPTSPQERSIFRQQEKQRYETPFRAFTYRVGGMERVVGPVRSTQAGNLSKARGHTLLVDDRPKYVTILELVRDAVARLPNAQGTRADIVTLLKDSQYLSESAQESMLSSVVSGALDRLHYEGDPSVKYDSKRKIWVYLHSGRSVEEFERLHALGANVKVPRPKSARKPAKPKKDLPKIEMPENSENRIVGEGSSPGVVITPVVEASLGSPKVTRKLVPEGGVKSLLGKSRTKANDGVVRVQGKATGSILPARTIVQDTTLVRTQPHNVVKKSVTISADTVAKTAAAKSIVKVITSAQPSTTPVRTVQQSSQQQIQRNNSSVVSATAQQAAQQILQLKSQLLASGDKIMKASSQAPAQKKQSTTQTLQAQQQQQVIVMKQQQQAGVSGETGGQATQQQMIVINQQQILMDSLTMKHQKQLQQLLSKQQQQVEQQSAQNQSIQLILGKQSEQGKVVGGKGSTPMIVVKETGGKGNQAGVQQMILVKPQGSEGEAHITQQQLQLLLKQQQTQTQAAGSQAQTVPQQMIIVKQQPDQKSVQVIPQTSSKGASQPLTIAQIQQQRVAGATSLLTHPRVVAHVASTAGGTSLIKPQVVTSGTTGSSSMVAKVVPASATTTPIITMESLLTAAKQPQPQQGTVRLPGVARGIPSQYAVVSLPQQRVVQTSAAQVSGASEVVTSSPQTVKMAANQGVRIPGLNLSQIAGKQVLLASKPTQAATLQGQNVVLGSSGGQALLVSGSGAGQQLALLQHGAQQILLPPGALKGLQGLKVIPLTPGKNTQQAGRQQVFARIINPSSVRPTFATNIMHDGTQQPPPSSSKE